MLLLLALLQWLVSRRCDRCLTPRKIDDYSVRLDFLETVIYQVQFASSWRIIFDLVVVMAANSNPNPNPEP